MDERRLAMEILDAQENRGPVPLLDGPAAGRLLADARRIAVVGASDNPFRPSHDVMGQLIDAGFEIVPVNPNVQTVLGLPSYPTLEEAAATVGPIDIVDVFRRPEHTPDIARSAVSIGAKALWLQLGVVNWEAAQIAHDAGLAVVMDRCTAIDLRRMGR
jgi:uncharacterized protein